MGQSHVKRAAIRVTIGAQRERVVQIGPETRTGPAFTLCTGEVCGRNMLVFSRYETFCRHTRIVETVEADV